MELPREVLLSIDPIVDMAGVAAIKGVTLQELETTRRKDPSFPQPLGELSCGPVFAYGAVRDFLDGGGAYGGDAQLRHQLVSKPGTVGIDNLFIALRYQDVPPIGRGSNPAFITPVWEDNVPDDPLAGGRWVAGVFLDGDMDCVGDDELEETYEVLVELDLIDLMERRDWTMWLQLHIQALVKVVDALVPVVKDLELQATAEAVRQRANTAAGTLMLLNTELADAAVQKVRDPDCPHQALAEVFAVATVWIDTLLHWQHQYTSTD